MFETTPNAAARHYRIDTSCSIGFQRKRGDRIEDPFLQEMLSYPAVEELLITSQGITVRLQHVWQWEELEEILSDIVSRHAPFSGFPHEIHPSYAPVETDPQEQEVVAHIEELLLEKVRPNVQMDGGDVRLVSYKEGVAVLELQGACVGCPSSTATMKLGIERLLKYYIPELVRVEALQQNVPNHW